jgi:hypothetical protein
LLERLGEENAARTILDVHGLRHARGMELAFAGASEFEIMAPLEHATTHTARIYSAGQPGKGGELGTVQDRHDRAR